MEVTLEQLGHIVRSEQSQQAADADGGGQSAPKSLRRKRLREQRDERASK